MLLKGLWGVIILVGIMVAGCTTLDPGVAIQAHTPNFSPGTSPLPNPTLYIPNKVPFSSLPDVTIESIPGMVVNISSSNKSLQIETRDDTPITAPPSSEKPLFTTFHIGESANDGNIRVTLNAVMYNKSFPLGPYNQQGEFSSYGPGYQLMMLNVTIQDLSSGTAGSDNLFNSIIIKDPNGLRIIPGLSIVSDGTDGNPGRTGYLFYEVPSDTTGITLDYYFPDAIGVVAKFDVSG